MAEQKTLGQPSAAEVYEETRAGDTLVPPWDSLPATYRAVFERMRDAAIRRDAAAFRDSVAIAVLLPHPENVS